MAETDEEYQKLQSIYLSWNQGRRPLSGYIRELQELLREEYQRGYDARNVELIEEIASSMTEQVNN